MVKITNTQMLADISNNVSNIALRQEAMIGKQETLEENISDISTKLFDHKEGIAIHVHDNTKFRKLAAKYLYGIYAMVLGVIGFLSRKLF